MSKRTKALIDPHDISIMTLIAFDKEASSKAVNLLRKYGIEKPTTRAELESALANLYSKVDDKIAYENELAQIHPHKRWLLKYVEPKTIEKIVEVKVPTAPIETPKVEVISNADGLSSVSSNNENNKQFLITTLAVVSVSCLAILALHKLK